MKKIKLQNFNTVRDVIKNVRFIAVFIFCKLLCKYYKFSEKYVKNRTFFSWNWIPGEIILRYCYDYLKFARKLCRGEVITISGTNGKTTTSGLIAEILRAEKRTVVHNKEGSNVIRGISVTLAQEIPLYKKADNFVLEVDESNLRKLYNQLPAEYLVLTNLFNDPVCSDGRDKIIERMQEALSKNPNVKLIINADDPILDVFKVKNTIRYGIRNIKWCSGWEQSSAVTESKLCHCKQELMYTKNFYSTIGHYSCKCGNTRVKPDFEADLEICDGYSIVDVNFNNKNYNFVINLSGLYNAYNALAAISLALLLNVKPDVIQKALDRFTPIFGRGGSVKVSDTTFNINLVKNATGLAVVLNSLKINKNDIVLIAANKKIPDGMEISWFDRVDLSKITDTNVKVVVSGEQTEEICRILVNHSMAEDKIFVEPDIEKAISLVLDLANNEAVVHSLVGFSALTQLNNIVNNRKVFVN